VTSFTLSAAPPRASPSSLVSTTPLIAEPLVERARGLHRVLADHRVDDEVDVLGRGLRLDVRELLHEGSSIARRPGGVVDDDVAAELLRLGAAAAQISTGVLPGRLKTGILSCSRRAP
jgi:hypothetical protein